MNGTAYLIGLLVIMAVLVYAIWWDIFRNHR